MGTCGTVRRKNCLQIVPVLAGAGRAIHKQENFKQGAAGLRQLATLAAAEARYLLLLRRWTSFCPRGTGWPGRADCANGRANASARGSPGLSLPRCRAGHWWLEGRPVRARLETGVCSQLAQVICQNWVQGLMANGERCWMRKQYRCTRGGRIRRPSLFGAESGCVPPCSARTGAFAVSLRKRPLRAPGGRSG